jgi:hypothetical protein
MGASGGAKAVGKRARQRQQRFSAQERHEVFIGEQPTQPVHDE